LRESWVPYCFAVVTEDRRGARGALQKMAGVLAAEPAGADLHVYLDPATGNVTTLEHALDAAGFAQAKLQPLEPSLEDVFIAAIQQEELGATPATA
jgi:ABC-2 type transport system ATP-binding protein